MGLFSKKEICSICGINEAKNKLLDCYCCKECMNKAISYLPAKMPKNIKKEEVVVAIKLKEENEKKQKIFEMSKKVGSYFEIDEKNKLWLIPDGVFGGKKNPKVYTYSDIMNYELLEDGETISKGGLGSAIVGGALFGGVGAIVGGATGKKKIKSVATNLQIKIILNNLNYPNVYINFITVETKKDSMTYKMAYSNAQEILSLLSVITNNNEQILKQPEQLNISAADEILKYKQLQEQGIITEQEFNEKKKQLLGL